MNQNLEISPSPHISKHHSTRSVMLDVIIALVPAIVAAGLFFRMRALILIGTCVLTCVIAEWLCNIVRKKPNSLGPQRGNYRPDTCVFGSAATAMVGLCNRLSLCDNNRQNGFRRAGHKYLQPRDGWQMFSYRMFWCADDDLEQSGDGQHRQYANSLGHHRRNAETRHRRSAETRHRRNAGTRHRRNAGTRKNDARAWALLR